MVRGKVRPAILLIGVLASLFPEPAVALSPTQIGCSMAIGNAGRVFVRDKLKLYQRCRGRSLAGGTCVAPDPVALARIDGALQAKLVRTCTLGLAGLAGIGFPAACTDANPIDGFTPADLGNCIRTSHDAIIGAMLDLQYDASIASSFPRDRLACQQEVAKESAGLVACVLKSVQKCRARIMKGKLPGVPAHLCATADQKTKATIEKCHDKLEAGIGTQCSDADIGALAICTPDTTTVAAAVACLVDRHTVLTDGPAIEVPVDLIDYEYAVRGGLCGDGVVNSLAEECDGSDDAACPGACGAAMDPNGFFACLCTTTPRLRVVEQGDADTDSGWTGNSADTDVADGGGYLGDLYDCDGSGLCHLGPSCSSPPHSACGVLLDGPSGATGDQICDFFGQGKCRKERTATGPHCFQDIQKKCDLNNHSDPVCNEIGDFCAVRLTAAPNPVSSGGVTVCNVTVFSEDVVGTVNVLTGESTVRAPQRSRTYNRTVGSANKPCPVCGGFCGVSRERCAVDADCAQGKGPCVTAPVCSDGPNAGKECRTVVPFGNATTLFGTTSVDCPPEPGTEVTSDAGLDLYITNRTTGMVTMAPTEPCTDNGVTDNACLGGTAAGRPCVGASECPGGSCAPQCYCAGQSRPNACLAACVGGANDAVECGTDSDCPGGFCHIADCRLDPEDSDSVQEGVCTAGPVESRCSTTTYRPCTSAEHCSPPACPFCTPGESCVTHRRACFLNGGIVRQGAPRTPEGVSVGIYCIQGDLPAVNTVAGFPGPAAFTKQELQVQVP